jgi:hypothetical protein
MRIRTAAQRHRSQERKAQAEREAGIPDRVDADFRTACMVDLRGAGGPLLYLEPRRGYHAWRRIKDGKVIDCAALKTLLHRIADELPRTRGMN